VLEDNVLVEHYVNKEQATSYVGNVYLGKVQNVLPSMEPRSSTSARAATRCCTPVSQLRVAGPVRRPAPDRVRAQVGQPVLVQVTKTRSATRAPA